MACWQSTQRFFIVSVSSGLIVAAGCGYNPERVAQIDESIAVVTGALGILNSAKDIANAGKPAEKAAVPAEPAAAPVAATAAQALPQPKKPPAPPVAAKPAPLKAGSPELAAFEECKRVFLAANRADMLPQCATLLPPVKSAKAPSR